MVILLNWFIVPVKSKSEFVIYLSIAFCSIFFGNVLLVQAEENTTQGNYAIDLFAESNLGDNIVINPLNENIYIENSAQFESNLFDSRTGERINKFELDAGGIDPVMAFSPINGFLYKYPYSGSYALNILDVNSFDEYGIHPSYIDSIESKTFSDSSAYTFTIGGIEFNPSLKKIYLTVGIPDSVYVLDEQNSKILANITVGPDPEGIVFNPSSNKVYVENSKDGSVSVIDSNEDKLLTTIAGNGFTDGIALNNKANKIYLVGQNLVSVIDGTTDKVVKTIQVNLSNITNHDRVPYYESNPITTPIVYNPITNNIYLAGQDSVVIIDGNTDTVIDRIPIKVNSYRDYAITDLATSLDSNKVYVSNGNNISIISPKI